MTHPVEHGSDSFFSRFEISPKVKSCIVIPVKDEEAYILKTLTAFLMQVDVFGEPFDSRQFEILVLANNCSDHSVACIREFQHQHPHLNIYLEEVTLPPGQANIGYVRRKLMECAYSRLCKNGGGIIMTTDGDTTVSPDWIGQTQREIHNGADAVGGRILLYPDELAGLDEVTRLYHGKDEKYQLLIAELEGKMISSGFDPVPRHHQHFNGSFAITTECYERSGGVPVVKYLEDCAFFERLESIDARIRHSYQVNVHTSARCIGRTEVGLSYQLNVWKNLGHPVGDYLVESCASVISRLTQKRSLMALWESRDQTNGPDFYRIMKQTVPEIPAGEEIYNSFNTSLYFGEWYARVNHLKQMSFHKRYPDVPIDTAIKDLQTRLHDLSSNHNFSQTSIL